MKTLKDILTPLAILILSGVVLFDHLTIRSDVCRCHEKARVERSVEEWKGPDSNHNPAFLVHGGQ